MEALGAGLFALFFFGIMAVSIGGLILWVIVLVEVVKTPEHQFRAAGTDKVTWVLVVALAGWIGALIYLAAKRKQVKAAEGLVPPPPPGWYPDPGGTGALRWWDGIQWTEHRPPPPPPS